MLPPFQTVRLSAMNDLEFPKAGHRARLDGAGRRGKPSQARLPGQDEGAAGDGKTRPDSPVNPAMKAKEAGGDEPLETGHEPRQGQDPLAGLPSAAECAALKMEVRCLREIVSGLEAERDYLRRLLEKALDDRGQVNNALLPGAGQAPDGTARTTAAEGGFYQPPQHPAVDYMNPVDAGFPPGMMLPRRGRTWPVVVAVILIILLSFLVLDKLLLLNSALSEW